MTIDSIWDAEVYKSPLPGTSTYWEVEDEGVVHFWDDTGLEGYMHLGDWMRLLNADRD